MEYELEVTDNAINKVFGIMDNDDEYSPDTTLFRVMVKGKTATNYEYGEGVFGEIFTYVTEFEPIDMLLEMEKSSLLY